MTSLKLTSLLFLLLGTCLLAHGAEKSSPPSTSSHTYQSRSDTVKSSLGSPYYTNDLATFVNAGSAGSAVGSQAKPESRQQLSASPSGYSQMNSGSSAASNAANAASAMGINYQSLLQALANSGSAPTSSQLASMLSPSALNSALGTAAAGGSGSTWNLPSTWASLYGGNSLFNMFSKPAQTGPGRRSSLTSRLRNFMNSLFRRETSSPYMGSGSSYSYAYRPAPYGFGATSGSGGNSAYGSSSNLFPGTGFGNGAASLYGTGFGNGASSSSLYSGLPAGASSLYGSASNYRPSFVPLPNSFGSAADNSLANSLAGSFGQGSWGSGAPSASAYGSGKNSGYNTGYGSGGNQGSGLSSQQYGNYNSNGYGTNSGSGSRPDPSSAYQGGSSGWANSAINSALNSAVNSASSGSSSGGNSSPSGAIWSSQLQSGTSNNYYQDSGLQAAASSYYPQTAAYAQRLSPSSAASSPVSGTGSASQQSAGAAGSSGSSSQFSERQSSAPAVNQKA